VATETQRPARTSLWSSPAASYYLILASTSILLLVGLAVVLSSSSISSIRKDGNAWSLFLIQLVALLVGVLAMAIGSRFSVAGWKHLAPWILYISVGLLIVVMTNGYASGGNKNWIRVGPITVQPSEFAKLGLALFLGVVLARFRHELTTLKRILVPGGIAAAGVLALVLAGRDMGTAVVISLLVAAAFWVAGVPVRFFVMAAVPAVAGAALLVIEGVSRSTRIGVWLDPSTCDPQDTCLQSIHGTWALASGGLWGLGPGMSREKWGYLPAADNDFIFAIIGEEFGLIGTLLVLLAFAMMVIAVSRIVRRHRDPFVKIATAGIGAWIIGQAFINIAVVLELLPVTGVPLPLVSSGGSSLVMSLAAIGALMAFARSEPGAKEAFAARPSVMRRYVTVVSRWRRG